MKIRALAVLLLLTQWHLSAQTWESLGIPPANSQVSSIGDTLFAATSLNLFFSVDEGMVWSPILTTENAPFMESNYIRPDAHLDNGEELKRVESLVLEDLLFFLITFKTSGSSLQLQRLYRSTDRGATLEVVHQTAISAQGGLQIKLPRQLSNGDFLMQAEGFANFVGPLTDYLISMDNGETWTSNTYAEFQQGAMKTPPFLLDVVNEKLLGVEAVRTFPFQNRDELTLYDLPDMEVATQKTIPIGLDSFRLRSAFYHDDAAYLFYFRVDDDGTILLAKTSDLGEGWDVFRFLLNNLSQATIKDATFEVVDGIIYMQSPNSDYYRLIEGNPIKVELSNNPHQSVLAGHEQDYSLNVLSDEEVWTSSNSGLFQYLGFSNWQMPSNFAPYPSSQSIAKFQENYYLLDDNQRIYQSEDGQALDFLQSSINVEGLKAFDDAIFAFGDELFFSLDGNDWQNVSLEGVDGKIVDILALEDELVIATEDRRFYFLRDINGAWAEIEIGEGERAIGFDEVANKLYVYELPVSDLDTDISIYEKTSFGDDEWIGQGASLFGQRYPSERFKLFFYQDQIVKLDYAEENLLVSKDGGFSWQERAPELGQLIDIALTDNYCYLATRNNGVYRTDISEVLRTDSIVIEEGEIDLAVFMTVDKPRFEAFDNLVYSITLINSGPDTAKNVSLRFFPESDVNGLAFVEAVTSKGNTRGWDNIWRNIELAPSERANLKLTYFARINEPLRLFAEVAEAAQNDPDSAPANFSNLLENEDDEAQITAYPMEQEFLIDTSIRAWQSQDLSVYPTLVRESVNIQIEHPSSNLLHLRVINSVGKTVVEYDIQEGHNLTELEVSDLAKGTYFVQVTGQRQLLETRPFIKL